MHEKTKLSRLLEAKSGNGPRQQFHFMLKAFTRHIPPLPGSNARISFLFLLFNTLLSGANVWRFMEFFCLLSQSFPPKDVHNFPVVFGTELNTKKGILTSSKSKEEKTNSKQWIDRSNRKWFNPLEWSLVIYSFLVVFAMATAALHNIDTWA